MSAIYNEILFNRNRQLLESMSVAPFALEAATTEVWQSRLHVHDGQTESALGTSKYSTMRICLAVLLNPPIFDQ